MNISIEKKKTDCISLPKGWQREEVLRKTGLSAGKIDVYYYSPSGKRIENKPQLSRHLGDTMDTSTFDYQNGKLVGNPNQSLFQRSGIKKKIITGSATTCGAILNVGSVGGGGGSNQTNLVASSGGLPSSSGLATAAAFRHQYDYSRGMRTDASLVPPIRQTASIFKQPVTIHKNQEGKVKTDLKHGIQEKPKQLFWEKRLEGLRACDIDGTEFGSVELPKGLKPVGPNVNEGTLLQSVATALHASSQPVTGQTASKTSLQANACAFLNPDQPLMYSVNITDDDIKKQEDRVLSTRKKLQDALRV